MKINYVGLALVAAISLIPPASHVHAASPYAVGTVSGSFDVTLSGNATYSIPIRIAPGTAGTEPKVAITYDSQASGGPLGAGWSIAGLSTITRGPKSLYFDHVVEGVTLDENDALYLDGQRLVAVSQTGTDTAHRIEYRKEVDDLSRVIQTGATLASSTVVVRESISLRTLLRQESPIMKRLME